MKGKAIEKKKKHEFALFVNSLSLLTQGKKPADELVLSDENIVHRIMHVLRLRIKDECILFDKHIKISAIITAFIGKKQISLTIQSIHETTILKPHITFLLPMLKRDDLQAALYGLAEIGVTVIQLVFTQKTEHSWNNKRDGERAERIMISAAEQSKNFVYPEIRHPIALDEALKQYGATEIKIFFDPEGNNAFDVMQAMRNTKTCDIVLLIGPEGDLHQKEKELVKKEGFLFCALTPTVIRAFQAAILGAGFIRSFF